MSAGAIAGIVLLVIIVGGAAIGVSVMSRRRRLRERFGPEYDRVLSEHGSTREAEAELTERERRVRQLDIRPLSPTMRARYSSEWAGVQEQFVDAPQAAVRGARALVVAVMNDRGYPTEVYDQMLADLSVGHAATVDHFRAAHDIGEQAAAGTASTEDLRQAMIHYRVLFAELLGETAGATDDRVAGERTADDRDASYPGGTSAAGTTASGATAANGAAADDMAADDVAADDVAAGEIPAGDMRVNGVSASGQPGTPASGQPGTPASRTQGR